MRENEERKPIFALYEIEIRIVNFQALLSRFPIVFHEGFNNDFIKNKLNNILIVHLFRDLLPLL